MSEEEYNLPGFKLIGKLFNFLIRSAKPRWPSQVERKSRKSSAERSRLRLSLSLRRWAGRQRWAVLGRRAMNAPYVDFRMGPD